MRDNISRAVYNQACGLVNNRKLLQASQAMQRAFDKLHQDPAVSEFYLAKNAKVEASSEIVVVRTEHKNTQYSIKWDVANNKITFDNFTIKQ